MAQKWNLQDIRPAEPRRRRVLQGNNPQPNRPTAVATPPPQYTSTEDTGTIVIENGTKKRNFRTLYAIFAFVAIVSVAGIVSALTGRTEVVIFPQHREPNVNAEFTAFPDARDDELTYEVMTLEATGERQVAATGQTMVETQATGEIEIIKTTPGAERLIKNTRFKSSDGLVFRIQESVVVPGAVRDTSGTSVPGTIRASVFSDGVGEQYNLPANTTFNVPGFEENGFTELYNAISARNPSAFTGGYSGPRFQVNPDELATARQALQIELRDKLLADVATQMPAGFIGLPGAIAISYSELPAVAHGDNLATIREQAILQIPLFTDTDLGSFLARETVATYTGTPPVRITDPSVLSFSYTDTSMNAKTIANEPSLTFTLTGRPHLVWTYDVDRLKSDLATLPKSSLNNAVSAHPGIEGAQVYMTPFWQQHFPENPDDITIIEELRPIE
jgi:hypothetical protein